MTDTTQAAAEGFDTGPAFAATDAPPVEPPTVEPKPLTADRVQKMLRDGTGQLNAAVGTQARANLQMTEFEAGLIAPGLVKYANSRPQVRAALEGNEYLKAAGGLGLYGIRTVGERAKALEAEADFEAYGQASEPQPSSPVDVSPVTPMPWEPA